MTLSARGPRGGGETVSGLPTARTYEADLYIWRCESEGPFRITMVDGTARKLKLFSLRPKASPFPSLCFHLGNFSTRLGRDTVGSCPIPPPARSCREHRGCCCTTRLPSSQCLIRSKLSILRAPQVCARRKLLPGIALDRRLRNRSVTEYHG